MDLKKAQVKVVEAAQAVGQLMRRHLHGHKRANEITQHDIKLELDVRSQQLIGRTLVTAFPDIALLGEEGITGDPQAENRWVVDPIDGTVNFAYTIPHACVSIALQRRTQAAPPAPASDHRAHRGGRSAGSARSIYEDGYQTVLGVVYDPFADELWTALRGGPARLNGRPIRASSRTKLTESIISIGFAKDRESLNATLPYFNRLVHRVRKIRMMGSAALGLVYVATGRFDAYIERGIRLWDIAAGGFILECAGGEFWRQALDKPYAYRMVATNGQLRKKLRVPR